MAEDRRIQKQYNWSKRQLEKAVMRDHKRKVAQKRKDKLHLFQAASEMVLSGLSSKEYAVIRSALCKPETYLKNVLFTEKTCGWLGKRSRRGQTQI